MCDRNGVGIHAGAANGMIVSNLVDNNTIAGIRSDGTTNNFIDNLLAPDNTVAFLSNGTNDNIIASAGWDHPDRLL